MRRIVKAAAPAGFNAWRASHPGACYEDLADEGKDSAQAALCADQGHLCAYCQSRIEPTGDRMRVEHWVAQTDDASRDLEWKNLLGVCPGKTPLPPDAPQPVGRKRRQADEHCDRRRGHRTLNLHPAADPDVAQRFHYHADGRIEGTDEAASKDIEVLNLKHPRLMRNRSAVFERLRQKLGPHGPWSAVELRRQLEQWRTPREGRLPEFTGVAEYHLERWLRKAGGR